MNKIKSFLPLLFLCFFAFNTVAEKAYMKYGKIKQEEIDMTICPIDSNASAVVLAAVGYTKFKITERDIFTEFHRHVRIKIFDKESFNEGNLRVVLYKSRNGTEKKLMGLKGAVFNMKDGKLEKSKLNNKNIFRDELDKNHNIVKVAMPDVKEGSIIEFSYVIQSPFTFNLQSWYFQENIPTLHSEYQVDIIEWYQYKNWMEGYENITKTSHTTHENFSFTVAAKAGNAVTEGTSSRNVTYDAEVNHMKYVADNVPAFKNEPYITTPQDYISSIQFELQSTRYPWTTYKNHTNNWQSINKTLMNNESFGLTLKNDGHLKDIAASITSKTGTPEQKACMAYNHINKKMVWNGNYSLYANTTIRKAYNDNNGKSSDINLNLVALCRKIGLDAQPIIISTRNHGMIRPGLISISQFNHVIAGVKIEDQYLLLDATDSNCPYNLLPSNCLNGQGRLVREGMGEWVDLYTNTPKTEIYLANLVMDDELNIAGTITYKANNYAAVQFRKKYKAKDDEEAFITSLESKYSDSEITNMKIENIDSIHKPIVLKANIALNNRVNKVGDMVFLNPKVINRTIENIFKREERIYPVDYNYPSEKKYIIRITIPEGYSVDELPEKMAVVLPNNSAKYVFVTASQGRTILLTNQYNINQTVFPGNEYPDLRKFNEMIVTKEAEQVVLKKI